MRVRDGSTNNAILGNAIFSNAGLGIDLGAYGVNPNIACDAGSGANMAQNYPVLTQAVSGNGTGVRGTLNSRPNRPFLLQFFANPTCDSSGYGEGQIYLGQTSVVTSNDCNVSFVASLPGSVPASYVITATATDSANNTSEFSACVPVSSVPTYRQAGRQSAGQLAWTNTATGFVLEQTDSLSPPIQWTTVTNSPVLTNGQFVVTLSGRRGQAVLPAAVLSSVGRPLASPLHELNVFRFSRFSGCSDSQSASSSFARGCWPLVSGSCLRPRGKPRCRPS